MSIRNLKIGTRLGLGFALVLVFLTAIAVLGIWRLQGVGHATSDMASQALVKERLAADWLVATSTNSVRTFALVKSDDPHDQDYFQKAIAKTSLGITETSGKLLAMLDTPEEKKLYEDSKAKRAAYIGFRTAALKLKAEGQAGQAVELVDTQLVPALEIHESAPCGKPLCMGG